MGVKGTHLNKEKLSYIVGEVLELPRRARHGKAWDVVQAFVKVLHDAAKCGETISVRGFGKFKLHTRKATRHAVGYGYGGKKLSNWEVRQHPAKKMIVFKPSEPLLNMLNEDLNEL